MKTITELIEERNAKKKDQAYRKDLSRNFDNSTTMVGAIKDDLRTLNENWIHLSEQQRKDIRESFEGVMSKGVQVTNLSDAKPQIDINLRGMDKLDVNTVNINGLNETVQSIKDMTTEMTAEIRKIKFPEIKVPEVKVPEIKVPEIRVPNIKVPDVTIPEIKIPAIKDSVFLNPVIWLSKQITSFFKPFMDKIIVSMSSPDRIEVKADMITEYYGNRKVVTRIYRDRGKISEITRKEV